MTSRPRDRLGIFPGSWWDLVDNTSVLITYVDEALNGVN